MMCFAPRLRTFLHFCCVHLTVGAVNFTAAGHFNSSGFTVTHPQYLTPPPVPLPVPQAVIPPGPQAVPLPVPQAVPLPAPQAVTLRVPQGVPLPMPKAVPPPINLQAV